MRAAIALPGTPTIADLEEFQLKCQSQQATIGVMESTGQTEKAVALRATLWARYDAELSARRCQLADYSLAALNPYLPVEERQAAAAALAPAVAALARLSVFASPDAAERASHLERAGQRPTEAQRERAETHATLKKIRQQLSLEALRHIEIAHLRRDVVAQLTRTAAAQQPLAPVIAQARELPTSGDTFKNLTEKFAQPDLIEALFHRTGESLALEATLTVLIEADPANAIFWLSRARARLQLGWRAGAILDLAIASNLEPGLAGIAALSRSINETPPSVSAICQEWVDPENAQEIIRLHRAAEASRQPIVPLSPDLEGTARAAVRNPARRLYATSFLNHAGRRARALALIAQFNPLPAGLFPSVGPELGQQYEAELTAAGNDVAKHFAIQQRYAALFGITEAFWHKQITLLLATGQNTATLAATDVAGAMFAAASWVKEARARAEPVKALPESAHK